MNAELNPGDSSLAPTYVRVLVLEAVIIVLLWLLGRVFS